LGEREGAVEQAFLEEADLAGVEAVEAAHGRNVMMKSGRRKREGVHTNSFFYLVDFVK
jgi:hypothetical protein